jgi:hypothetical protein
VLRSFTAAAASAAAVGVYAVIRRERRLYRALQREHAAQRLTAGCLHRDMAAFQARIEAVLAQQAVVREAEQVLDLALAGTGTTGMDPNSKSTEGGAA